MPIEKIQGMLAEQLGVGEAPAEVQVAVIDEIGGLALQRLTMLIYAQLAEGDRTEFEALNEKKDTSGMQKFISEKAPNLEQLTTEAVTTEIQAFKEFQKSLPQE